MEVYTCEIALQGYLQVGTWAARGELIEQLSAWCLKAPVPHLQIHDVPHLGIIDESRRMQGCSPTWYSFYWTNLNAHVTQPLSMHGGQMMFLKRITIYLNYRIIWYKRGGLGSIWQKRSSLFICIKSWG